MAEKWVIMSGEVMSRPPAEPMLKVESREELVYLLGQAARPSTSPAPPPSCYRTRTRLGRSSRNGSMRWNRPVRPSADGLASARSPRSLTSCTR